MSPADTIPWGGVSLEYKVKKGPRFSENAGMEAVHLEFSVPQKDADAVTRDDRGTVIATLEVKTKPNKAAGGEDSLEAQASKLAQALASKKVSVEGEQKPQALSKLIDVSTDEILQVMKAYQRCSDFGYFLAKDYRRQVSDSWKQYCVALLLDDELDVDEDDSKFVARVNRMKKHGLALFREIAQVGEELVKIWEAPKLSHSTEYVIPAGLLFGDDGDDESILRSLIAEADEWDALAKYIDKPLAGEPTNNDKFTLLPKGVSLEQLRLGKGATADSIIAVLREHPEIPIYTRFFGYDPDDGHLCVIKTYELLSAANRRHAKIHGESSNGKSSSTQGAVSQVVVKSDNWQALNTMREKYACKVDVIYIDPPYNTGNDGFAYQDGMNEPSWMTMMQDRLELAREMLSNTGVIFISCDDNEQPHLRLLCNKIFGDKNLVNVFHWVSNLKGRQLTGSGAAGTTEYILCYAKHQHQVGIFEYNESFFRKTMPDAYKAEYKTYSDCKGTFQIKNELYNSNSIFNEETCPNLVYDICYNPNTEDVLTVNVGEGEKYISEGYIVIHPHANADGIHKYHAFRWSRQKVAKEHDELYFMSKNDQWKVYTKVRTTTFTLKDLITNIPTSNGGNTLKKLGFSKQSFSFPKPVELLSILLKSLNHSNAIVMDFFAGSGVTAHAVAALNAEDGGHRRCISVEQNEYVDTLIVPRISKVNEDLALEEPDPTERLSRLSVIGRTGLVQFRDMLNLLYLPESDSLYSKKSSDAGNGELPIASAGADSQPIFRYDPKLAILLDPKEQAGNWDGSDIELSDLSENDGELSTYRRAWSELTHLLGAGSGQDPESGVIDVINSFSWATGMSFKEIRDGAAWFIKNDSSGEQVSLQLPSADCSDDGKAKSNDIAWHELACSLGDMLYW